MSRIAGIDVGGTFTDLIVVDDATGEVRIAKVPTTVDNQAFGVIAALDAAGGRRRRRSTPSCTARRRRPTRCSSARSRRVGLITTRGFRDVLELGRRTRPTPYGLKGRFVPLIERRPAARGRRAGRCRGRGAGAARRGRRSRRRRGQLLALGAESVVIHFLHSYINPGHERARRRDRARALAEPLRHRRPHDRRRVPRVRARHDGGGQRRDPAGAAPLHRAAAARAGGARLRAATCW